MRRGKAGTLDSRRSESTPPPTGLAGNPDLWNWLNTPHESWTVPAPSQADLDWLNANFDGVVGFTPHLQNTGIPENFAGESTIYWNGYAIYTPAQDAWLTTHPDYYAHLNATSGPGKIWIPWGSVPFGQHAADVTSSAWQTHWVDGFMTEVALSEVGGVPTVTGLMVDDTNLRDWWFSSSAFSHAQVTPWDFNTGAPVTWEGREQGYIDMFTLLRSTWESTYPGIPLRIIINTTWLVWMGENPAPWDPEDTATKAPLCAVADYVLYERGALDPGVRGWTGRFSLLQLLRASDWIHAQGTNVMHLPQTDATPQQMTYELGVLLLHAAVGDVLNAGEDSTSTMPSNFDDRWTAELGAPKPAPTSGVDNVMNSGAYRDLTDRVWRRDFDGGIVLVQQKSEAEEPITAQTITLPQSMTDHETGATVTEVTIQPGEAAILVGANP